VQRLQAREAGFVDDAGDRTSDVEIISMFTPASASAPNIRAA